MNTPLDAHSTPYRGRFRLRAALSMCALAVLALSVAPVLAATIAWRSDADGTWNTANNWSGGTVPNSSADTAVFGDVIQAPRTITIAGGTITVGDMSFMSAQPYTIAATNGGSLTLDGPGTTKVSATGAAHTITAPVTLRDSLVVSGDAPVLFTSLTSTAGGNRIIRVDDTATVSFAKLVDPTGGRGLRKQGTGTLNLQVSGTNNTGATSGFIRNDEGSGQLNLYGTGNVGAITYNATTGGGTLGIGDSLDFTRQGSTPPVLRGTGILMVSGSVFFDANTSEASNTVLQIDLNGPQVGTGYDQLRVVGNVNNSGSVRLNNTTLAIALGATPVSRERFVIVARSQGSAAAATGRISGTFLNLPNGAVLARQGVPLLISYTDDAVELTRLLTPTLAATSGAGTLVVGEMTSLVTTVVDAGGVPVPGVRVTFAAPDAGPGVSFPTGNTTLTDSEGRASILVRANTSVGSYTVTAAFGPAVTVPASFAMINSVGPAAVIEPVDGTPQEAEVGTAFIAPLRARVTDAAGNPVGGMTVVFAAPATGPSGSFVGNPAVTTDAEGVATAPTFVANQDAGSYNVSAHVNGVAASANFGVTNRAAQVIPASPTPTAPAATPSATITPSPTFTPEPTATPSGQPRRL